ncbi:MAG: nitroreductase [Rhodanobacteraceae bacterium]|nr:nitroreductase [Rhodanobacteraceae bacterium]MBP9155385.1 nitroreductase [Xanthomonadales bacterium]HQW82172.1 nitroreductase [Pseudomonadota bacterium]
MNSIDLLKQRRSHPSRQLIDPGPDAAQLRELVETSLRVPDHGKLTPFRIIGVDRETGRVLGERLATITATHSPNTDAATLDKDRSRFDRAPICLIVVARLIDGHKIPAQEQLLSAGCVAYNLLLGAQMLGFGAQWITGWPAYDRDAAALLGLADDEHAIAFIHLGTPAGEVPERPRPTFDSTYREWQP